MESQTQPSLPAEEQEIDLLELAGKLWKRRKTIYKTCGVAVIVGLIIAFSIPKEYSVTVTLSPESGKSSSGLAGAAAMLGLGNFSMDAGEDAYSCL